MISSHKFQLLYLFRANRRAPDNSAIVFKAYHYNSTLDCRTVAERRQTFGETNRGDSCGFTIKSCVFWVAYDEFPVRSRK